MTKPSVWQRLGHELLNFEWFWLLLILPAAAFPDPLRSLALLAIPFLWLVRKLTKGRFLTPTPFDLGLLFFFVMALVGIIVSADMSLTIPKATGLAYGAAVFYGVVAGVSGRGRNLAGALFLFFLGGLGVAFLGLLTVRWSSLKLPVLESVVARLPQRLVNLPGAPEGVSPNQIAGTLLWVLPVCLALALASLVWYRQLRPRFSRSQWFVAMLVIWGSTLVQGMVLILTQSRTGIIAMVVATLMILVLVLWRFRWLMVILLVVVATGAILIAVNWGRWESADRLINSGSDLFVANVDDTVSTVEFRFMVWDRGLQGIRDFPITGTGLGTFRRVQPALYPFFSHRSEADIAHVHNHWLQAALDLGLPGLVAYTAIWLVGMALIWRIGRRSSAWHRALAIGFAGAFLAYSVYGLMDAVALGAKPGFIWWMLLGLIAAVFQMPERENQPVESFGG